MDKAIENAVKTVMDAISGFSFVDQAYMCGEIADRLKDEASLCMEIEYSLHESKNQTGHENS
jgi:hypothetical protein